MTSKRAKFLSELRKAAVQAKKDSSTKRAKKQLQEAQPPQADPLPVVRKCQDWVNTAPSQADPAESVLSELSLPPNFLEKISDADLEVTNGEALFPLNHSDSQLPDNHDSPMFNAGDEMGVHIVSPNNQNFLIAETPKTGGLRSVKKNLCTLFGNDELPQDISIPLNGPIEGCGFLDDAQTMEDVDGRLASLPVGQILNVPVINSITEGQSDDREQQFIEEEDGLAQSHDGEQQIIEEEEGLAQSDGEAEVIEKTATRKRQKNPQNWKKNVAKKKLHSGQEHQTIHGKIRRKRIMRAGCDPLGCKKKCHEKVTLEDRKQMFEEFYKLDNNRREKWEYIARHIEILPTGPRAEGKKKSSRKYYFRIKKKKVFVCKTMFLDTLDTCDSIIETVAAKLGENGAISPDKRKGGSSPSELARTTALKNTVRAHIASIPRMDSHYCRASTTKEFLIDDFQDCADLHEAYVHWMDLNYPAQKKANVRQYRDVFNTEYNISFFTLKKDLCDLCTTWDNTPPELRQDLEESYKLHITNKEIVTTMKNADTERAKKENKSDLVVAHFDFEKNLICPKLNTSTFYYKRKLCVSNFTIVDVGRFEDCCYVYDESVAHKGSNEVASLIFDFLARKSAAGIKEAILYADNCGGQNKNRNVITMLVCAAVKLDLKITVRYLVKGHTHNACDNVHSLIDRRGKKRKVFVPDEWYTIISESKKSIQHPVVLEKVDQTMIYNWNDLADKLNLKTDESNIAIPWQFLRMVEVSPDSPHKFRFKVNFEDEPRTVNTKRVGRPVNFCTYQFQLAYNGPLPISTAKHKDLMFYCEHNHIPPQYHAFFKNLISNENVQDDKEEMPQGRARAKKPRKKKEQNKKGGRGGKKRKTVNDEAESEDVDNDLVDL